METQPGEPVKIVDLRDNTMFRGVFEKTLPAHQEVSAEDVERYFKYKPTDTQYVYAKRPASIDRIVLRRETGTFYIIPDLPVYRRIP